MTLNMKRIIEWGRRSGGRKVWARRYEPMEENEKKIMPFHLFAYAGKYCVLDIENMRAMAVDDAVSQSLGLLRVASEDPVPPKTRDALTELGLIRQTKPQSAQKPPIEPISSIALFVTQACNLRCVYCYEDKTGARMEEATALRAIDWLIEGSRNVTNLYISFFGGEPFLNLALMKKAAAYAREKAAAVGKRVTFLTTTNATLLDEEAISFVVDFDVDVIVSMDGPRDIHDVQRPFPDNRGSYDVVYPNAKSLVEKKPETRVHAVVVDHSQTERIKSSLQDLGFRDVTLLPASASLFEEKTSARKLEGLIASLEREAEDWAALIAARNTEALKALRSRSQLTIPMLALLHNKKLRYACGAGVNYVAVSCAGDLFLCHRFVGLDEYKLGNVFTGLIERKGYEESPLVRSSLCAGCFARYYCAGWCKHDNVGTTGSAWEPSADICAMKRRELELAIGLIGPLGDAEKAFLVENEIFPRKPCPLDF